MKLFKTIILTSCILSFSATTINAADIDCNNPEGFHQKIVCKMSGKNKSSDGSMALDVKKEPGGIGKFFKKIKDFGGKNIGQEG